MSGCSCSAGVKGGWQPGSGGEQLLEGVEFVDAPLGGGVQVGLHDREALRVPGRRRSDQEIPHQVAKPCTVSVRRRSWRASTRMVSCTIGW